MDTDDTNKLIDVLRDSIKELQLEIREVVDRLTNTLEANTFIPNTTKARYLVDPEDGKPCAIVVGWRFIPDINFPEGLLHPITTPLEWYSASGSMPYASNLPPDE